MNSIEKGFSLLELLVVIVIVGILGAMTTDVMLLPLKAYLDLQRRTSLVDVAESALRQMQRDIRAALPNSIRIAGGGTILELLHTREGGRYRLQLANSGSGDVLDFASADSGFDVLSGLQGTPAGWLVIYNLGYGSADAYAGGNRAALANTSTTSHIDLNPAKQFPLQSPQQRFFVVDSPVTYRCDLASRQLLRYSGYAITASQADPPAVAGQVQAKDVTACSFVYASAVASRSGMVTLQLTLTDAAGESVQLMQQVHVFNAP